MATYVLIPGAGCGPWHWHLLVPQLRARGHDVVTVELPCNDDAAGLGDYTDAVVDAIGDRTDLVVVAHSLAGFTGPLVCERLPADLLVLLTAMVPASGEPPGEWWDATGFEAARRVQAERDGAAPEGDREVYFHDLPADLAAEAETRWRGQSGTPMALPWPLPAWPRVATRFLLCRDDRFFPEDFMRRLARDRLGIAADAMAGGHFPMLSRPKDLAERLEEYRLGT
ncbi:alpha/beta hydrolase family protein [Murinocardiopsis flavida]|uniref:Alpha/beta hydrolase family protein n=1 Tax=Murinocardiopsis flavida TaxID=645275 RepID=A0A2P8CGS1_9ACTN|nr:alpha/beta hydrolase [Murinocardiopsis flavida]PSK84185.1 alpha/beta hydrolase family protein [Murinocardiopsis flavida]